jgi:hypothetical protein
MFTPMSLGARGSLISPGWTIDLPSAADFSMSASHDLLVKVEVVCVPMLYHWVASR